MVAESTTPAIRARLEEDPVMIVWWATEVECVSALARLEREGRLTSASTAEALGRMDALATGWHEIQPVPSVRRTARRLLRVHALRAADSLQLAAAVVASEAHPESLEIVSLDDRVI
ncbi:MAG: type II toxin-antitoxin system VapC family toxin, partial [Pseudonocardiaceae bacterium]